MIDEKISRRRLLQTAIAGLAALPAATLITREAGAAEALSEGDPAAKSLAYTSDASKVDAKVNPTYKPGQKCASCIQFTGKAGAADGPCNIFPGKLVKAGGWCKVWVLKPGATPG
jgi:hypothetical protein